MFEVRPPIAPDYTARIGEDNHLLINGDTRDARQFRLPWVQRDGLGRIVQPELSDDQRLAEFIASGIGLDRPTF
jgi:hypothetical protein